MQQLHLRGAFLRHCVVQSNKEGGVFVRINASADYTEAIRAEMDWIELPTRSKNMDLEGEFAGGRLTLTGDQQTLGGGAPELRIDFDQLTNFRAVRVKDKDQESTRDELRFHVISMDPNAAALCQSYKAQAKKSLGSMEFKFTAQLGAVKAADPDQFTIPEASTEPADTAPGELLSIRDGMAIKTQGRKGKRHQQAQAASDVSVEISPEDRAVLDAVINQSLEAVEGEAVQ